MVEIRPSRPDEAQAQKDLWQAAFGDDPRYIDWFYQCCWRPEDMLLLLEDGKLASMLALLPQTITLPEGYEDLDGAAAKEAQLAEYDSQVFLKKK